MPNSSAAHKPAAAADTSTTHGLYFDRYSWPAAFLRHRVRLSRGLIQYALLDLIRQRSEGRMRRRGEPAPEWSGPINWRKISTEWECSDRELRADWADLLKRGVIDGRRSGNDVEGRLLLEAWAELPSVKRAGPRLVAEDDTPADDTPTEEERKKAATREQIKFQAREGRGPSPVRKFDVPPSSMSVTVHGADAEVTATRQGTHCTVEIEVRSSKVNHLASTSGSTPPKSSSPPPQAPAPAKNPTNPTTPSVEREILRQGLQLGADRPMVETLYGLLRKGGGDPQEFVRFVDQKRAQRKTPILKGLLPTLAREFLETPAEDRAAAGRDRALELLEENLAAKKAGRR